MRTFGHIAAQPMPGDVVEIHEGDEWDSEVMLRVLSVLEDHVWFKQYGKGRMTCHVKAWTVRLTNAKVGKVIRPGDHDLPF